MSRFVLCLSVAAMLAPLASVASAQTDLDAVAAIAERLAAEPYDPRTAPLPGGADDWDYDQYRRVRHFPQHSVWFGSNLDYQIQLIPRGYIYKREISVTLIEPEGESDVRFVPEHFEYLAPDDSRKQVPAKLGIAGFRIMHRSTEPSESPEPPQREDAKQWWELASFLGASYYRATGYAMPSGTSARGVGVDVGGNERFPEFTRYWIVRPDPGDASITVYALLDGDCVTGAYQMIITPGATTTVAVTARLFGRPNLAEVHVAPLTSMFMWGEGAIAPNGDRRPEVHDADGLLIHEGVDRWRWRTLSNPPRPSQNLIGVGAVAGFGLIQRDTAFGSYRDTEANYHQRPSVWIEPKEPWGPGRIALLLWPADHEGIDNVAASFVPADLGPDITERTLEYTVVFRQGDPVAHRLGKFERVELRPTEHGRWRGSLDAVVPPHSGVTPDSAVAVEMSASAGAVRDVTVKPLESTDAPGRPTVWRIEFTLDPGDAETIELTGRLRMADRNLTETWDATWIRPR